jgi:hypothetical protein
MNKMNKMNKNYPEKLLEDIEEDPRSFTERLDSLEYPSADNIHRKLDEISPRSLEFFREKIYKFMKPRIYDYLLRTYKFPITWYPIFCFVSESMELKISESMDLKEINKMTNGVFEQIMDELNKNSHHYKYVYTYNVVKNSANNFYSIDICKTIDQ